MGWRRTWFRILAAILVLGQPIPGAADLFSFLSDRLTARDLDGLARIEAPRRIKEDVYRARRSDRADRITFVLGNVHAWRSFAGAAYENALYISIMARDAPSAAYDRLPAEYVEDVSSHYRQPREVLREARDARVLRVTEALYERGSPTASRTFVLSDPERRLQLVWHCEQDDVSLRKGVELMNRMAASFRIVAATEAVYEEVREQPRRAAREATRKRALAREMLARAGYLDLQPGRAVLRDGLYVEWMEAPEPRFQVLKVLGEVVATARSPAWRRPMPATVRNPDGSRRDLGATLWVWQHHEDRWQYRGDGEDYYPFQGITAALTADLKDPLRSLWVVSHTVRVAEAPDDRITLEHFRRALPGVEALWREGKLVQGDLAQAPFPIPPAQAPK